MKSKIKKIFHPVAKEFRPTKYGFHHSPADDFIRSQWQNSTVSVCFVIYRWLIAIFFLIILILSMTKGWMAGRFFIYFTNWGLILCTLTNLLGGVLLLFWYFHPKYFAKLDNFTYDRPVPLSFKIYWALHTTTLAVSIVITIVYWIFLFPLYIETIPLDFLNICAHAFNSILMLADIVIVAFPVRIVHIILPIAFTLCYLFFSLIFFYAGGTDAKGHHYIYPILDWNKPGVALALSGEVLVLYCIIAFAIFGIYKIRVIIHRNCFSSTKIELPPSITPPYFDRTISGSIDNPHRRTDYIPTTDL